MRHCERRLYADSVVRLHARDCYDGYQYQDVCQADCPRCGQAVRWWVGITHEGEVDTRDYVIRLRHWLDKWLPRMQVDRVAELYGLKGVDWVLGSQDVHPYKLQKRLVK